MKKVILILVNILLISTTNYYARAYSGETTHADPKAIKSAFLRIGQAAPPIILISFFRLSAVAMALQAGYDDFLAKPVGPAEILAMINKANQNTNH